MSHDDGWDGVLPAPFMLDLPRFWAIRNSANRVIITVPGIVAPVYREYLPRALRTRYGLEGEALEAAEREVMAQIRTDIAPPSASAWAPGGRGRGWWANLFAVRPVPWIGVRPDGKHAARLIPRGPAPHPCPGVKFRGFLLRK